MSFYAITVNSMGLSAMTDDNTGKPLGTGYVSRCTSAGNLMVFADPASANFFVQNNPGQFNPGAPGNNSPDGDYSQGNQAGLP